MLDSRQFISQAAAARALSVSRQRVHAMIQEGLLGTVDFEGKRYVTLFSVRMLGQIKPRKGGSISKQSRGKQVSIDGL